MKKKLKFLLWTVLLLPGMFFAQTDCESIPAQLTAVTPSDLQNGIYTVDFARPIAMTAGIQMPGIDPAQLTYQWDFGGGAVLYGQSVTFTFIQEGLVTLTLNTIYQGCTTAQAYTFDVQRGAPFQLYSQYNGQYDYTAIGNTLNLQANAGILDNDDCGVLTQSSAGLSLAPGQTITAAYLYWAGSGPADLDVKLNNIDVSAERTFYSTIQLGLANYKPAFGAFADVTGIVNSSGTYTLSSLDISQTLANDPTYCTSGINFAGWSIVVIYMDSTLPYNQVSVYDGFKTVDQYSPLLNIYLDNLNVVDDAGAKIGFLAWEGDMGNSVSESLKVNNTVLGNALNPAGNPFNSTNSFTGASNLWNMDIDYYDIQNYIAIGDTDLDVALTTGQDAVIANNIVVVVNSELPEATIEMIYHTGEEICGNRDIQVIYMAKNDNSTDVLPFGTPISIYADGLLVGSAATTATIPIGGFEVGNVTVTLPPEVPSAFDLSVVIDDDGTGTGTVREINENNNTFTEQIILREGIEPHTVSPLTACHINTAFEAVFDLADAVIPVDGYSYDFYSTYDLAEAEGTAIDNPSQYQSADATVYVRIVDELFPSCYDIEPIVLTVDRGPLHNGPFSYVLCEDIGSTNTAIVSQLTVLAQGLRDSASNEVPLLSEANEDSDLNNYTISYHASWSDALAGDDAIGDGYEATDGGLIYIRIVHNSEGSCPSVALLTFEINNIITASPEPLWVCGQGTSPETGIFNLSEKTDEITAGDASLIVRYYGSYNDAIEGGDNDLPQASYTAPDMTEVYALAEDPILGCRSIEPLQLRAVLLPQAQTPAVLHECDTDGDGQAVFNLDPLLAQVASESGSNQIRVYSSYSGAINAVDTDRVTDTQAYLSQAVFGIQTLYIRLESTSGTLTCPNVLELHLQVDSSPQITVPAPYAVCDNGPDQTDGLASFDLLALNPIILAGLDENDYTLSYHTGNFQNAYDNELGITDPSAHSSGTGTIWARVVSVETGCITVVPAALVVNPLPSVNTDLPAYVSCEVSPGLGLFNLDAIRLDILGNSPGVAVSFYQDQDAAVSGVGAAENTPYQGATGTLYARVAYTATLCAQVISVSLEVLAATTVAAPEPISECDLDGDTVATFDLDPVIAQISGQAGTNMVSVYETYDDAFHSAINNRIVDTDAYENIETDGSQLLYIRVDFPASQSSCFDIVELQLIVHPVPVATEPEPYEMCDNGTNDTDGIAIFDLTILEEGILVTQDAGQFTVTFNNGVGQIANPASYNSASDVIIARVNNNATGCFKEVDVALIVNPLPVANDPDPYTLCDSNNPGDEREVFDLTTKTEEVIGLQDGINVTFFKVYEDAVAGTGPSRILNPEAYTNTSAVETIFVRVTVEETGCYRIVLLDVRVEPIPVLVMPTAEELTVCDTTGLGIGVFDLEALVEDMVNGATDIEVSFHTTYQDAIGGNNPITEDLANYHNVNPFAQFLYVRVVNSTTGCTRLEPYVLSLVVEPAPQVPEHLEDLVQCDDRDANGQDNKAYFDLTVQDAVVHDALGTTPATLTIHYFTSEANAGNGAPRITNPAHYYGAGGQTIWVRVETPDTGCFSITTFQLFLDRPLLLATPTVLALCNESLDPEGNDGQTQFDLTVKDEEILGEFGIGQGMTVAYFEADPRVDPMAVPIDNPTAYTNPPPPLGNPKTLFVMVTTPEGCKSYTTLTIKVLPLPEPDKDASPLVLCDDNNSPDGMELFNLTDAAADIRNNDTTMVLTYYESFDDANNRENQIVNITNYNSGSATIWVRAETNTGNAADPVCYQVVSFELIVNPLPELGEAGVIAPYAICEQNTDGIATFDFNTHMDEILGEDADPADYTITFHRTEADRLAGIAMPYIYTNTSSPNIQNIIVQVINKDTGCTNWAPLTLLVEEAATANPVTETFFECDYDGTNDGRFTFDLTRADDDALGTQNPADYSVTYYTSLEDAEAGDNAIPNPTAFQNTPEYQMIWVRVTNEATVSGCNDITTLELFVERIPEPLLKTDHTTVCIDYRTEENVRPAIIDSGLDTTHTFVWFKDAVEIVGQTGPMLTATEPGNYTVIATSATGCVSDPIAPVTIEKSGPAGPIGHGFVVGNPFGEAQVVTVLAEGFGDYQYSLDNGPWQNSNVFENVSPYQPHTIYVRDTATADPCNDLYLMLDLDGVSPIGYPNFFTPNGDSYHDTWNIFGLDTDENRDAKIYIFDRYGKLLKQISAAGAGWDGTYNGQPMPGDDYWFTVAYTFNGEAREFKAHFALKR
ncbi:T9SS type B sorting domain-containing protein [Flavobacterium sp. DGU11]|uniref:T9SS type B sorting domain-containing protein n=1 Tax=Flavobacterium arundinis TaxID=3139143 RepID=A0ABU9HXN8_9FLAO